MAETLRSAIHAESEPTASDQAATAREASQPGFEESLAELEQIVCQLEEGQLGLSDSLARYELGVKRLKECYQLLERAERRIELLERVDADGEPVTRPFDGAATIDRHALSTDGQVKPAKPTTRRAVKPAPSSATPDEPRDLF